MNQRRLAMRIGFLSGLLLLMTCSPGVKQERWCDHPLRKEFAALEEVKTSGTWFKVYLAGEGVFAITEPYNFQEVISYLIVGKERNILFDTGMGMGSIAGVVRELSPLPVIVINSHTHYDHIGGNHEFETVYAIDTAYTHHFAEAGWTHEQLKQEVRPDAFCKDRLPELDTFAYAVKPYKEKIRHYLHDGDTIDLGGRTIEVWQSPGHTPDGIALLDRKAGYLWTGDNYYTATIWLFFDGTDLNAYFNTVQRFADISSQLKEVFPAHNTTATDPRLLNGFLRALEAIRDGSIGEAPQPVTDAGHPADTIAATFAIGVNSFRIRRDYLNGFRRKMP